MKSFRNDGMGGHKRQGRTNRFARYDAVGLPETKEKEDTEFLPASSFIFGRPFIYLASISPKLNFSDAGIDSNIPCRTGSMSAGTTDAKSGEKTGVKAARIALST